MRLLPLLNLAVSLALASGVQAAPATAGKEVTAYGKPLNVAAHVANLYQSHGAVSDPQSADLSTHLDYAQKPGATENKGDIKSTLSFKSPASAKYHVGSHM